MEQAVEPLAARLWDYHLVLVAHDIALIRGLHPVRRDAGRILL